MRDLVLFLHIGSLVLVEPVHSEEGEEILEFQPQELSRPEEPLEVVAARFWRAQVRAAEMVDFVQWLEIFWQPLPYLVQAQFESFQRQNLKSKVKFLLKVLKVH